MNQVVLVLDFGGQYRELIARRVREMGVYSEIIPGNTALDKIRVKNPLGIILTGGPSSVHAEGSPRCDAGIFSLGVPVLGICYGAQLMAHSLGGGVFGAAEGEYGCTTAKIDGSSPLFKGLPGEISVLMSHSDFVSSPPPGFRTTASTESCPHAAFEDSGRGLYALQFHPETDRTEHGPEMLKNFVFSVCGAAGDYTMREYIDTEINNIRERTRGKKVLLALSGGVDSSVCAALLSRAIPGRLVCIFVDHGLMRKNEGDEIEAVFSKRKLEFVRVNAQERFLSRLAGVTDPEKKRKIIGHEFIEVFQEQAALHGDCKFLAQGTIYPDIIESGTMNSAVIKSHHNVGGLPEQMNFEGLIEPLRGLFKDEVRKVGRKLGLPSFLVNRQPFPGPGLAIRVIGEVTKERLDILRDADFIWREEVGRSKKRVSQYFAVLTDLRSVGVMGDGRTYDYTLALRAVVTGDFMTCEYARLPHELLARAAARITNEVRGINRVVYDITGKPPATIEWE